MADTHGSRRLTLEDTGATCTSKSGYRGPNLDASINIGLLNIDIS
jgi:hypothetical protein